MHAKAFSPAHITGFFKAELEEKDPNQLASLGAGFSIQKGVTIDIDLIPDANHFFTDHLDPMIERVSTYLNRVLHDQNFDPLA